MRVLITGVTGFVGSHLSKYLLTKGVEVWGTAYKKKDFEDICNNIIIKKIDITNALQVQELIDECRPNYIFHLAAQSSAAISWKYPQQTMDINIIGTLNLLESIRKAEINPKILFVGSSEEYGTVEDGNIPISEELEVKPTNPYAISKISQNMIGELYVKSYNMQIVIVRSFNQIGIKQDSKFAISYFAKRIAEIENGATPPIIEVGNLNSIRDFLDVRDAVNVYWEIIEKGLPGEIYNVGRNVGYRIKDILDMLLTFSGVSIEVVVNEEKLRPIDIPVSICDNTKLRMTTNWEPRIPLDQTLLEMLNYWRKKVKAEDK